MKFVPNLSSKAKKTVITLAAVLMVGVTFNVAQPSMASADSKATTSYRDGYVYFWFRNPKTGVQVQKRYFDSTDDLGAYKNQDVQIKNLAQGSVSYAQLYYIAGGLGAWVCLAPGVQITANSGAWKVLFTGGGYNDGHGVDVFNHTEGFRLVSKATCGNSIVYP